MVCRVRRRECRRVWQIEPEVGIEFAGKGRAARRAPTSRRRSLRCTREALSPPRSIIAAGPAIRAMKSAGGSATMLMSDILRPRSAAQWQARPNVTIHLNNRSMLIGRLTSLQAMGAQHKPTVRGGATTGQLKWHDAPDSGRRPAVARRPARLPKRFPVGSTYVVEARGSVKGMTLMHRYVQFPDGRRVELAARLVKSAPTLVGAKRRSAIVGGHPGR